MQVFYFIYRRPIVNLPLRHFKRSIYDDFAKNTVWHIVYVPFVQGHDWEKRDDRLDLVVYRIFEI